MSGPKVSSYELEQRRLAALRRQQEEELRRRMEEERRRRIEMDYQLMEKNKAEANGLLRALRRQWQELVTRGNAMKQPINSNRLQQLELQIQAFTERYSNARGLSQDAGNAFVCTQQFGNIRALADDILEMIRSEHERFDEINRKEARKELARHMEKRAGAAAGRAAEEKAANAAINDLLRKITSKLSDLPEDAPPTIAEGRKKIQEHLQLIRTCFQESAEQQHRMLRKLYERDIAQMERIVREWRELEPLRQQCFNMCSILNMDVPEDIGAMSKVELLNKIAQLNLNIEIHELQEECTALYRMLDVKKPPALQGMSKAQLQQLRDQLFEVQLEQRGRAYIAQAVEETMREMGYNLAASRNVNYTNEYLYSVHDDTVLRVKHEPNGQISMAVGLGTSEANHGLTFTERNRLIPEMQAFCTQFEEIQRRLKEKGVQLKQNIVLRQAEDRYAQAINISDFGLASLPGAHAREGGRTANHRRGQSCGSKQEYLRREQ